MVEIINVTGGLSLRDYFAAHADITGTTFPTFDAAAAFIGIAPPAADDIDGSFRLAALVVAKLRYIAADAMMQMRSLGIEETKSAFDDPNFMDELERFL